MNPEAFWYVHERHEALDCHCIPVVDVHNRILSHFSPTLIGIDTYGPHMRARMEDLKEKR